MRGAYSLVFAVVLSYLALRYWRQRNGAASADRSAGFRPAIGYTHLDGMESICLLLENKSDYDVWAEELEIFLSGLTADEQTAQPSLREIQKVRQVVPSDDVLPISLAQVIYKAAGDPQRRYSFVFSSVLRFRIGEEWFEKKMDNYRVQMLGLTVDSFHKERKPVPHFKPLEKPQAVPALATKGK